MHNLHSLLSSIPLRQLASFLKEVQIFQILPTVDVNGTRLTWRALVIFPLPSGRDQHGQVLVGGAAGQLPTGIVLRTRRTQAPAAG